MKLLFLCKRRPLARDLLTRPYGRFFYLPRCLAEMGHEVTILLLDYKGAETVEQEQHGMRWLSVPVRRPLGYLAVLRRELRENTPDWLIGFSDTYFGIIAEFYARRYRVKSCIDAYDNYESYMAWCKPLHWLWRRALRRADLVTAAGPGLLALMSAGRADRPGLVLPMAADPSGFEPGDREGSRLQLGLAPGGMLVGYCGSMHRSRGVDVLFAALELLRRRRPDIGVVHSGRTWSDVPLPDYIESLGYLDDAAVPSVLRSMDVLVACNRSSAFGSHSYPVKLYEAMACGIPVVATDTLSTRWILAAHPELLVPAEDPQALCEAIERQLDRGRVDYGALPDWQSSAVRLSEALASVSRA